MPHLRRYLLLLPLLLLLFSPFSWADVTLTEAEYQELTTIFTNLGNRLNEQATTIMSLENSLKSAQEAQGKLQLETEIMSLTLNVLKKSYDSQRQEALKTTILASLISAGIGLVVGLLIGS